MTDKPRFAYANNEMTPTEPWYDAKHRDMSLRLVICILWMHEGYDGQAIRRPSFIFGVPSRHALPNVGGLSQTYKTDKKRFFEQKWARCPFCSTKIRKNFLDWMGCLKSHNNPPWPLKNRILHRCRFRHTSYCRNLPPWIITILKRSWYEKYLKDINY